ncbi:MAG: hypothetical protein M8863_11885 [marine benthic group bacterium]|nr:hypothetical protein [Gemmatimonadota bacterium]
MSQRRRTTKHAQEKGRSGPRPTGEDTSTEPVNQPGGGATWLDRVKNSAELAGGENGAPSPFYDSEAAQPQSSIESEPEADQASLPWGRPTGAEEASTAHAVDDSETSAPDTRKAVHVVDAESLGQPATGPAFGTEPAPERPELDATVPTGPWGALHGSAMGDAVPATSDAIPEQTPGPAIEASVGLSIGRLRTAALEMARRDAEAGLPALDSEGRSESEQELRDRCLSLFRDWTARQRDRLNARVAETEGQITETAGRIGLNIDRFERITTELFRLKKRQEVNRSLVESTLDRQAVADGEAESIDVNSDEGETRAFKTHWYALAITFLGIVEFLANAPVFGALLPRDPLTEQQIRYVAETSEGWAAGFQRVVSQFVLRPDAALLAAGVVTFLCVLAHFFGHSLRRLLLHKSAAQSGETVRNRSASEYVVPMVLSGLGLALVLGVLFEARVTLGEVAVDRFAQDSSKIEELRRNASWLRVDGNLVAANEQANRADDLEALAKEQREYAASMSGLSFPILLLNTTLVLVAISAAYFHMRDTRRDRFNELPWERQRRELVDGGDTVQERIGADEGRLVRLIGELKSLLTEKPLKEAPALVHQLEATIVAYRAENGRLRGLDPREIPAFAEPVRLELALNEQAPQQLIGTAEGYEEDRQELRRRFTEVRNRFTKEATTW